MTKPESADYFIEKRDQPGTHFAYRAIALISRRRTYEAL
jgi:hypothetical protein